MLPACGERYSVLVGKPCGPIDVPRDLQVHKMGVCLCYMGPDSFFGPLCIVEYCEIQLGSTKLKGHRNRGKRLESILEITICCSLF